MLVNANAPKLKDVEVPPPNWIDLGPAPSLQHIWFRHIASLSPGTLLRTRTPVIRDGRSEKRAIRSTSFERTSQVTEFILPHRRSGRRVQAVDALLAEYGIMGDDRVRCSVAVIELRFSCAVLAEEMLDMVSNLLAYSSASFSQLNVVSFVRVS